MPEEPLTLLADKPIQRLDKFVMTHMDRFSRAQAQSLIRMALILLLAIVNAGTIAALLGSALGTV